MRALNAERGDKSPSQQARPTSSNGQRRRPSAAQSHVQQQGKVAQAMWNLMQSDRQRSHPADADTHGERRRYAYAIDQAVDHAAEQKRRRLGCGMMVFMVTLLVTYLNLGFRADFLLQWAKAYIVAWPVAATTAFLVMPMAQRVTGRIVKRLG